MLALRKSKIQNGLGWRPRNSKPLPLHVMPCPVLPSEIVLLLLTIFPIPAGMIQLRSRMMGKFLDHPVQSKRLSFGKRKTPSQAAACKSCHPSSPSDPQNLLVPWAAKRRGMRTSQRMNQVGITSSAWSCSGFPGKKVILSCSPWVLVDPCSCESPNQLRLGIRTGMAIRIPIVSVPKIMCQDFVLLIYQLLPYPVNYPVMNPVSFP